jgi:predicted nucleic acid-binding protein
MKEEYVIDTSVTTKIFVDEEHTDIAKRIYKKASQEEISLIAPDLTWHELNSVFTKKPIPLEHIQQYLEVFKQFTETEVIQIVPSSLKILNKAAEIASTDTKGQGYISSFDATFHALAILNDAVFVTADKVHYNKTKDIIGSVMLLKNFK